MWRNTPTPLAGDQASKNVVSFQRGTSCCGSPKWSAVGGTSSGLVTGSRPSPAMALMACSLLLLTLASLKYTSYTSSHDYCNRPGADRAGYARTQPDASPLRAERRLVHGQHAGELPGRDEPPHRDVVAAHLRSGRERDLLRPRRAAPG